jgi:beta-N-acetylhexosaminidase
VKGAPAGTSARQIAARLTWITAPMPELDPATRRLLALGAGGFILFERNIKSMRQVARLCSEVRDAAARPLRIAIDQEGGHVIRLAEPLTRMPSLMALGAAGSRALAFEVARASALELAALGIDTVFGPVLDLASEPESVVVGSRSFGSDPSLVAAMGAAMIDGYHAGGLLAVAKHFPGHGRTPLDSHLELPYVAGSLRDLGALDLVPYRSAIAAQVDGIMTSHCVYPDIDDRPATLSPAVVTGLARNTLEHRGLLITDGLAMDAIARRHGIAEAAVAALAAGVDAVMPLTREEETIEAIAAALENGALTGVDMSARLERADALTTRLTALRQVVYAPRPAVETGDAGAAHLALRVADESLTLVEGTPPRLASSDEIVLLELPFERASPVEDRSSSHSAAEILAATFKRLRHVALDLNSVAHAAESCGDDVAHVIVITRDQSRTAGLREVMAALAARHRLLHVALRSPHDLALSAGLGATRVAAFSDTPPTLVALSDKLTGARPWFGTLPVPAAWTERERAAEVIPAYVIDSLAQPAKLGL